MSLDWSYSLLRVPEGLSCLRTPGDWRRAVSIVRARVLRLISPMEAGSVMTGVIAVRA